MGCCCGKKPIVKQNILQKQNSNEDEKRKQQVQLKIQNPEEKQDHQEEQKQKQNIQLESSYEHKQQADSSQQIEKVEYKEKQSEQLLKIENNPNPAKKNPDLIEDEINPIKQFEETQSDKDVKDFIDAISSIVEKNSLFRNSQQEMEKSQGRHFRLDDNSLNNMSQQNNFIGPKITNKNICDIGNKYDFSKVQEFTEYKGEITIERVIQKQKSAICTYIGKINNQYCCVKLIPMVNKDLINKWIQSVKNAQQQNDFFLNKYCQRYHFYKIEELNNQSEHCNCYIICQLEQFNLYTFSHHQLVTLDERIMIACDVIQIILLALKDKKNLKSDDQKISTQIFSRMFTAKRNNFLISKLHQNNQKQYRIVLSDWQILLPEFEVIIPNKKIQNEDFLYQELERNFRQILSTANLDSQLDQFTKRVLMLMFFRVNFELLQDLEINGFIREETSLVILQTLNEQENKHQAIFLINNIYYSKDDEECRKQILEIISNLLQNTNTQQEKLQSIINLLQSEEYRNEILNAIQSLLKNEKNRQQKLQDINQLIQLIQNKETRDKIQQELSQLSQTQQIQQQISQSIKTLLQNEENMQAILDDITSFLQYEVNKNITLEPLFNLFKNDNIRMQFLQSINNFSQDAYQFISTKFKLNYVNNFKKIYQIYLTLKFQTRGEAIRSTFLRLDGELPWQKQND